MGRKTSVSQVDCFKSFVDSSISDGRFKNESEVIRSGLRLLKEEHKIVILKKAIHEGIESGTAQNFDPTQHLE
jgi:antitoxin ParD1/3/4